MASFYKCLRCGKPATLHYKEIFNGVQEDKHYCAECAEAVGVGNLFGSTLSTLSQLFKLGTKVNSAEQLHSKATCRCGMTYDNLVRHNLFGCSECYDTFADVVEHYIAQLGGGQYMDSVPSAAASADKADKGSDTTQSSNINTANKISKLRAELSQAIAERRFMDCERIDREIRELEGSDNE